MKRTPSASRKSATATYRRRLKRQGMVRLEVHVRKEDVALVRNVAQALNDPARAPVARRSLRQQLGVRPKRTFKELLATAPLEGIDLTRSPDLGRDVDL